MGQKIGVGSLILKEKTNKKSLELTVVIDAHEFKIAKD
jgi:hypothetical protein